VAGYYFNEGAGGTVIGVDQPGAGRNVCLGGLRITPTSSPTASPTNMPTYETDLIQFLTPESGDTCGDIVGGVCHSVAAAFCI
jgi:hypothetical protein